MSYLKMLHDARSKRKFPKAIVLGTERSFGRGKIKGLIRWDNKRKVVMGVAPQRTGKSVLLFRTVEESYKKFGLPWLVIDPKKEFYTHKKPLKGDYHKQLSVHPKEVVGEPSGLKDDIVVVTPSVLKDAIEYTDYLISPYLTDFLILKDINQMESLLLEFLELSSEGLIATRRMLQLTLHRMRKKPVEKQTFKQWLYECDAYISRLPRGQRPSHVLMEKLYSLVNSEKLEVKGTKPIRFISDLLLEGKIVVLQTNLSSTPIAEYDVAITLAISLCVENRFYFKNGFGVFIDEVDKPCSSERKKSSLKKIIIDIPLKYGAFNISLTGVTQKLNLVADTLIDQADYIIGSRWTFESIKWLTDKTACTSNIGKMALNNLRSSSTPNVEWVLLAPNYTVDVYNSEGELVPVTYFQKFYPLPTRSAFHEVGAGNG